MQIKLEDVNERAAGREALQALMREPNFLSDAWNQDLWVSLAQAAFEVPFNTALEALRLDTTRQNRIQATMKYLEEESKS